MSSGVATKSANLGPAMAKLERFYPKAVAELSNPFASSEDVLSDILDDLNTRLGHAGWPAVVDVIEFAFERLGRGR